MGRGGLQVHDHHQLPSEKHRASSAVENQRRTTKTSAHAAHRTLTPVTSNPSLPHGSRSLPHARLTCCCQLGDRLPGLLLLFCCLGAGGGCPLEGGEAKPGEEGHCQEVI